MNEINVHEFSESLIETYRRYLYTFNLISDSEPELRQEVWEKLKQRDIFALRPLVTSIPAYMPSVAGQELIGRSSPPMLSPSLSRLNPKEFDLRRPLYGHQAEALEKAQLGRNLIVATGTGSGKTECFLLPVIDDAARNPGDGVRAIFVYPMNALANDQLDRMRRLLSDLPEITFGRYTGDTPHTRQTVPDEVRAKIAANERFTREEIRERPPHILLTNFAMLEYLLLRPDDAGLFRHQSLRFVVLDEAHTYNGAQGIDVSLLMRRLRQAYRNNRLQFILTSATLAEGDTPEAREEISRFGRSISGTDFSPEDVIFGSTVHGFDDDCCEVSLEEVFKTVPDEGTLTTWLRALDDLTELKKLIAASSLPGSADVDDASSRHEALYRLFKGWGPVWRIHEEVVGAPRGLGELANDIWGEETERAMLALQWLMIMASHARASEESAPLLPVRFHFFLRGLNGASVCLSPECDSRSTHPDTFWSRVYLESRTRCEQPCESRLLPLSTCFQCGMPAVSVWATEDGKWQPLPPSDKPEETERRLSLTWDTALSETGDEDEDGGGTGPRPVGLCLSCGRLEEDRALFECCDSPLRVELRNLTPKGGDLKQCPRCGTTSRPYPSVLRDFRSGEDAATAVIGEQVMRSLPDDGAKADTLPARGRRMLAFSDSRQRAAFYAPYLKRTTAETEYSKPLYDALLLEESANGGEPVALEDVAKRFRKEALKRKIVLLRSYDRDSDVLSYQIKPTRQLLPADEKNLQRQAYISLLQHFCSTPRQRLNMPGMGLASAEIYLTPGDREDLPNLLPEVFAKGEREGFDFLQQLLQLFLMRRALLIDDESVSIEDIGAGPKYATFHYTFNDRHEGRQRYRWNPYAAEKRNRRTIPTSFTAAVVSRFFGLDIEADAAQVDGLLGKVWEALHRTTLLSPTAFGGEYQVDASKIFLTTNRKRHSCDACGRLTVFNIAGQCVAPGCNGRVRECSADEIERRFANHHYRHRLLSSEPLALEVVEHTAQLTNAQGQAYQDRFIKGEINVLSSSTTFEMGVDVGQLKAVLLRNVPPTASSYIQRAGRAGRRRDGAAYAVTYARSLPHDQFYYHNPGLIVRGKVPVPLINLTNTRLAQRHVNSFLLGRYLRKLAPQGRVDKVAEFFLTPDGANSPAAGFRGYIESEQSYLLRAVAEVLPEESPLSPEECLKASADGMHLVYREKVKGPLDSFDEQLKELLERQAGADTSELRRIIGAKDSLERLINQLKGERIIDFLSSAHWLPSYAFPQDTIRLLVRQKDWSQKMRLERDREVGISEYAPGSEIIADGRLFRSRGVTRPRQGFDIRQYSYCRQCRRLVTKLESEQMERVCECGLPSQPRKYIMPEGFQTFHSDEVPEPNLYRVRPPSNTELFLVSGARPEDFRDHRAVAGVTFGYRKDGRLFRANPGRRFQQFRICKGCGASFDKTPPSPHQSPWGMQCRGTVFRTHLAHEFETDTLQLRFGSSLGTPDVSDRDFWLSFQTAFVSAAAEVLAIPRADLDATYQSQSSTSLEGELVVYDRVPGGAGYVRRIEEGLPRILERTLARTRDCDNPLCDPDGSCYTCLRSYGNQFYWDRLSRRKVFEWLQTFVSLPTGQRALDEGMPGSAMPGDGRLNERLAYCDDRCREALRFCASRGLPLPEVGFELADERGSVVGDAELAWPETRLAVLLPEQSESADAFRSAGWTVLSLDDVAGRPEVIAERLRG